MVVVAAVILPLDPHGQQSTTTRAYYCEVNCSKYSLQQFMVIDMFRVYIYLCAKLYTANSHILSL